MKVWLVCMVLLALTGSSVTECLDYLRHIDPAQLAEKRSGPLEL